MFPVKLLLMLFLVSNHAHCGPKQFPWDEDYSDVSSTSSSTAIPQPNVPSSKPVPDPGDEDHTDPGSSTRTTPQTTRPSAKPDSFPWDEDYAENTIPIMTTAWKPRPTFTTRTAATPSITRSTTTYSENFPWDEDDHDDDSVTTVSSTQKPVTTTADPLFETVTKPLPGASGPDQFPWDEDYPEPTSAATPTPRPSPTASPPSPSSGTSDMLPWDMDYPELSTKPTGTSSSERPSRSTASPAITSPTTVVSGPLPWDEDYPELPNGPGTSGPTVTTAVPFPAFPGEGPGNGRPSPGIEQNAIPAITTTTQSSATFLYFPAPTVPPLLSANVGASIQANLPCNEGNVLERFQCLGQLLLSLG